MGIHRFVAAGFAALVAGAGMAVVVAPASVGAATTLSPSTFADDGSSGSLRYLLEITAVDGDTVELQPGATYVLDRCVEVPEASADAEPAATAGYGQIDIGAAVTIVGDGATIQQTCPGQRVLYTQDDLTLDGVVVTGGTSTGGGGGGVRIDEVSGLTFIVRNSSIVGNCTTGSGGGFKMNTDGSVFIYSSTIAGNTSDASGGGFSHSHEGDVYVENSTVTGNQGVNVGGIDVRGGDLTTVYTDVVGNSLIQGTDCGVKQVDATGTEETGETEEEDVIPQPFEPPANILVLDQTGKLLAFGSVVALPSGGPNCAIASGMVDDGYNFADDESCGFDDSTDQQGTGLDPMLGALASNGGLTQTLLPQTGSPLVDAIPNAACGATELATAPVTDDQRHFSRPSPDGGACDIGAVEVQVQVEVVELQPTFTG